MKFWEIFRRSKKLEGEILEKAREEALDGELRGMNPFIFKNNPPKERPSKVISVCHGCGQKAYACPEGCRCAPCNHGFFGCITHMINCGPIEYFE